MERIMQHGMIKMKKGEVHPLFRLDYFAENLASLVETIVLSIQWLFGLLFILGIVTNIFYTQTSGSALAYILNSWLGHLFGVFSTTNNLASNVVALLLLLVTYYLSRTYFEYVKYNLHMLRTKGVLAQEKIDKEIKRGD